MNHKEFLEKYQPDCHFSITRRFGSGEPIRILVKALASKTDFEETMFLYEEIDIVKALDECCDRLNKNVRLYNNLTLAKRVFPFFYKNQGA